ncbi:MAG: hypothetical protein QGI08_15100 [Paracoccaceae bacterium]|jgi:hypothetical protein|nr:hypothetical protein [Paracoccaceae bacterium]MDP7187043.1 hypothetical protein [Paracoccaceae bacterium]
MPRIPHWERHLASALTAARTSPFAWGTHDCATWVFDLRQMLTDGKDVAALWRGTYTTASGAARVMRRLGWSDLEAMGRDLLSEPLPSTRLAQRGDILLGGRPDAFGICAGARGAFLTPSGLCFLPLSTCRLAWRL